MFVFQRTSVSDRSRGPGDQQMARQGLGRGRVRSPRAATDDDSDSEAESPANDSNTFTSEELEFTDPNDRDQVYKETPANDTDLRDRRLALQELTGR